MRWSLTYRKRFLIGSGPATGIDAPRNPEHGSGGGHFNFSDARRVKLRRTSSESSTRVSTTFKPTSRDGSSSTNTQAKR